MASATLPAAPGAVVGPEGPWETVEIVDTPEGVAVEFVLAGLGSRALARMLDSVIQYAMFWGVSFVANIYFAATQSNDGWIVAVLLLVQFCIFFLYDVVFELAGNGQTLGKRALGIQVVRNGGRPVDLRSSIVRNLLRFVDMLPSNYLVGSIAVFCSKRNRRLGDMAAGTIVVRVRRGDQQAWQHTMAAVPTVPTSAVAGWDASLLPADELGIVRSFLDRRLTLPDPARVRLGAELDARVRRYVTGIPDGVHPEFVLEGVVVAKAQRA